MSPTRTFVRSLTLTLLLGSSVAVADASPAAERPDLATVVAEVNGEPITLGELRRLMRELEVEAELTGSSTPEIDPPVLVERLVNLHLVFQEARNIGFDELPEFETTVRGFKRDTLRGMVLNDVVAEAPGPTDEEIEATYRTLATEVQLSSALFATQEAAEAFRARLSDGSEFAAAAQRAREDGTSDRVEIGAWVPRRDLAPEIVAVVDGLADGALSGTFAFGTGFAVVRRLGVRVPEDAELRETAAREATLAARDRALDRFAAGLQADRIQIDTELLGSLDFDGRVAEFDTYLTDDRVVATVDDEQPILVADVAAAVKKRMFHGIEQAAEKARLNRAKDNILEELTTERAVQAEARRRGLDRLPAFVEDLAAFENRVLFSMFVQRVVDKEVDVTMEEVQADYDENIADFTDPGMVRLDSIVFADADSARRALDRVNAGADFDWLRVNATGRAPAADVPPESVLGGRVLMTDALPGGLRDAIEGGSVGDFRLYVESESLHHLVVVLDRVEPRPRPLALFQNEIASRLRTQEREASLDRWFARLREVSEVDIRVDEDTLRDLVSAAVGAGN